MDDIIADKSFIKWTKNSIEPLTRLLPLSACMTYEGAVGEPDDLSALADSICILGKIFSTETELESVTSDINTRLWVTYRKGFPQLGESSFTTDKGWGCMLRCGQMVIAEAMLRHHLGRSWQWSLSTTDSTYLQILHMFEDHKEALYSLHQISQIGEQDSKPIGEWYGPNTVAQVLKKLAPQDTWNKFNINVAMDNILILDEIRLSSQSGDKNWSPLILFIPLRLGLAEMNPIYFSGIKKCLEMPQSLGLIGGKPNHALYFIGFVGRELVYLDPHTTQDSGNVDHKLTEEQIDLDKSYHSNVTLHMPFELLDPSLSVCFLCSTEKEFDDLCNRLQHDLVDMEKTPLLELAATRPHFMIDHTSPAGAAAYEFEEEHLNSEDDEEFEVLE